jgi:hypothetical protein
MHHYTLTRQLNNGIHRRGVLTDRERFDPARNKRNAGELTSTPSSM